MSRALRTEPNPERVSCWCGGWGYFNNTAFDPPQLTYCGNCEDAENGPLKGLSQLQQDLYLARLGDYPGGAGCKRIAAAYDALASGMSAFGQDPQGLEAKPASPAAKPRRPKPPQ